MVRTLVRVLGALAVSSVFLAGCGRQKGKSAETTTHPIKGELTFTVVPYEAAEKLTNEYAPMATYLAKRVGARSGRFVPVFDYAGVIAALQSGQVDVAYLSSFPYALATSRTALHPLAMPWVEQSLMYKGILFTRADSPVKTLQDLKGRTVAFGDQASTSGYLLPRAMLQKAGVFNSLKGWRNAGAAPVVVKAVENGTEDAGAAFDNVFKMMYPGQPAQAQRFRVIGATAPIPNGIYVARGDMPAADVEKLKRAFLDMNTDPEGRAAMLKAPNDRIVPADDKLFDGVREAAHILGLNLTHFDKKK